MLQAQRGSRGATWEFHALDAMTVVFKILAETRMLGRFARAIEALDYYEGASAMGGHGLLEI